MKADGDSAAEVTRRSRSNLAFALRCLPRRRREDMVTFYAFCRLVDDLADEPTGPVEERQKGLDHWRAVLRAEEAAVTPVERGVVDLQRRYPIDPDLFEEIICGMEMDLRGERYRTFEELERYCYRVASAVGLVSLEIFGYTNPRARDYAVELGHALQLTNILRDVREDLQSKGRIYLPEEDLDRFGVSREDLGRNGETEEVLALFRFQGARARARYGRAAERFPEEDRRSLQASELMRQIYETLFCKMEGDGFHVLSHRYRLSAWEKIRLLGASFLKR